MPKLRPPSARAVATQVVLSVESLSKTFHKKGRRVAALENVSLTLRRGTTLGVIGESGSGKSRLARSLMRLVTPDSGTVRILDKDVTHMGAGTWRPQAGCIQMVFQNLFGALNPRRRAGDMVSQGFALRGVGRTDRRRRARELFELVGLDPEGVERFPHAFSGGQRQRIGLARALALEPAVLVADEPVSALDLSVQAQVLALLADLGRRLSLSVVFITHDLRGAAQVGDRVAIMHQGRIVEEGPAERILVAPEHPYSR